MIAIIFTVAPKLSCLMWMDRQMDSHIDRQADMTKSLFGILRMCLK